MLDFLYLLETFIPNIEEVIGVIGGVTLILGLISTFFGYKVFNIILNITGFLVGASIALMILYSKENVTVDSNAVRIYILIGGVIGLILADLFHGLGVFLAIGSMGTIIAFLLVQKIEVSIILGIICGVIGIFLEKYVIILVSSFSGGRLAAMGLWFIGLSNGENKNTLIAGWMIGICGIAFQLWMEKFFPTREKDDSNVILDWLGLIGFGIGNVFSSIRKIHLREIIYKKDSNEINPELIKSLIGLPIVIGIILGCLFSSALFGLGVIAVLYILVMLQYIRKRKEDVSPDKYMQRFKWEKWVNSILDKNAFILFAPLFPGFFILILLGTLIDNELIAIFWGLIVTIGAYIIFFRAMPDGKGKEATDSQIPENAALDTQQNVMADVNKVLKCPNCGKTLSQNAIFCGECGAPAQVEKIVDEYKFCTQCGAKLPNNARFCNNCGTEQR